MPLTDADDPLRTTDDPLAQDAEARPDSLAPDALPSQENAARSSSSAGQVAGPFQPTHTGPLRDESPGAPAQPPPTVAGYEIESVLGRGGMGVVYKARHLALKRNGSERRLAKRRRRRNASVVLRRSSGPRQTASGTGRN